MKFLKKSLGQNFLRDKNVIKKIVNIIKIKDKNIIEIGPGDGALTDQILYNEPKNLILIEKDYNLFLKLKSKYKDKKFINIFCHDFLKFNLDSIIKNETIIFGNLPYNISSQILVKIIKQNDWPPKYTDLILMFQKELGEKIIAKFPSINYGRLSILSNLVLNVKKKFLVSPNCFKPKPKVNSIVIHFKPRKKKIIDLNNINNLEKITNILFSNKRKMINKSLKKILNEDQIKKLGNIKMRIRPSELRPEIYYKITKIFERN